MWAGWVLATFQASASPTTPSPTLPQGRGFLSAAAKPRVPVAACGTRPRAACRCLLCVGRLDARFGVPDRGSLAVPPSGTTRRSLPHFSIPAGRFSPFVAPGKRPQGARPGAPFQRVNLGFVAAGSAGGQGRGSQNRCHRSQHEWPRRSTPCEDRCSTYFAAGTARRLPGTPVTPVRVTLALGAPGAHNAAPSGQGEIPDRR